MQASQPEEQRLEQKGRRGIALDVAQRALDGLVVVRVAR